MNLKAMLRARPRLLRPALWLYRLGSPLVQRPLGALARYPIFLGDWFRYRRAGGEARAADLFPCLFDRTATTPYDPQYIHQAAWALDAIHRQGPERHVDVGSDLRFVAMLSALLPVTFIDIRPADPGLPGLEACSGSLLGLPFANASLTSLSCLHVVEHLGLGRYGDPLDPQAPWRGLAELQRVLAPGGMLYLSTPLGRPRVQFNGQWVFTPMQILEALPALDLEGLAWVDGEGRLHPRVAVEDPRLSAPQGLDYGLGMFLFRKPEGPK